MSRGAGQLDWSSVHASAETRRSTERSLPPSPARLLQTRTLAAEHGAQRLGARDSQHPAAVHRHRAPRPLHVRLPPDDAHGGPIDDSHDPIVTAEDARLRLQGLADRPTVLPGGSRCQTLRNARIHPALHGTPKAENGEILQRALQAQRPFDRAPLRLPAPGLSLARLTGARRVRPSALGVDDLPLEPVGALQRRVDDRARLFIEFRTANPLAEARPVQSRAPRCAQAARRFRAAPCTSSFLRTAAAVVVAPSSVLKADATCLKPHATRVAAALPKPVLVAADVLRDSAVAFEHERAGHDVIEERAVVADEKERARPVDQLRLREAPASRGRDRWSARRGPAHWRAA